MSSCLTPRLDHTILNSKVPDTQHQLSLGSLPGPGVGVRAQREPGLIRVGGPETQLDPQMEEEAELSLANLSS